MSDRAFETTVVDDLAEIALAVDARSFSDDDWEVVSAHVLDAVGCCIAASQVPLAARLAQIVDAGSWPSIGLGGTRVSPRSCIAADAALTHVLEFDAHHSGAAATPAGAAVVPALALGAERGLGGAVVAGAVTAGYEVMIEALIRYGGAELFGTGWYPTALVAALGSAAAAGSLLGLDEGGMRRALAIAGGMAGGLLARGDFVDGHYLTGGWAAAHGFDAAHLALAGGTGERGILDAPLTAALGRPPSGPTRPPLERPLHLSGCALKPYPCARGLHAGVDGVLGALAAEGCEAGDVVSVQMLVPPQTLRILTADERPPTPGQAATSAHFVINAALRGRLADPRTFIDIPAEWEGGVAVTLAGDDELGRRYPRERGARVEVRLKDGRVLQREERIPRGDPERPLSFEDVVAKFVRPVAPVLGGDRATAVAHEVADLRSLLDVAILRERMLGPGEPRRST